MMTKARKKLCYVIAATLLLCAVLTGCSRDLAPADQTIGALFELAAKGNAAPMQTLLGFESEKAVRSAFFEEGADSSLVNELQSQFSSAGLTLSEEELQELTASISAVLNKITYTAEITEEGRDTTVVTLKINGFSSAAMEQIVADAAASFTESIPAEDQTAIAEGQEEILHSYLNQYFRYLMEGFSGMEPTPEAVEVTVVCEKLTLEVNGKKKTAWLPRSMNDFSNDIAAAMFQ